MRKTSSARLAAIACAGVLALAATACGTSSGGSGDGAQADRQQGGFTAPDVPMQKSIGKPEGEVNILAWPGYAEDGTTDKSVDWVTPFEKQTGCQANVKYFATSDEAVNLIKTGDQTYCIIGEWDDMDALTNARPFMLATLDTFRDTLEGDTDPVSGPVVAELR